MTWDNRDVLPVRGPAARAVPGGSEANRERSPVAPVLYPPARPAGRDYPAGAVPARFPRYESRALTLAAVATRQLVAQFSGRPDRIDLHTSAAGLQFFLRNRAEEQNTPIILRAAGPYETDISKELVEVVDPTGAGGQLVTAVGVWATESTQD